MSVMRELARTAITLLLVLVTVGRAAAQDCTPEVCDGLDNDCNGVVDDVPGVDEPCGNDIGECVFGTLMCQGMSLACVGGVGPTPEICDDALDNDCDGLADCEDVDCSPRVTGAVGTCAEIAGAPAASKRALMVGVALLLAVGFRAFRKPARDR